MKKTINEVIVPFFLIWEPKIFKKSWVFIFSRLDNQMVIDCIPSIMLRIAPKRNVSFCELIEGVSN